MAVLVTGLDDWVPTVHLLYTKSPTSPVKIWEDPPQIATKTKFTKINRVEPFQISLFGPWEKLLKKNSNLYSFHIYEKYIFVYNQYSLYLFPYPIQDYVIGWMAKYQTIWRITHINM